MIEANKILEAGKQYLNNIDTHYTVTKSRTDALTQTLEEFAKNISTRLDGDVEQSVDTTNGERSTENLAKQESLVSSVLSNPQSSDRDRLLASAIAASQGGDARSAVSMWEALHQLEPEKPSNVFRLLEAYAAYLNKENKLNEASTLIEKAIALSRELINISSDHEVVSEAWLKLASFLGKRARQFKGAEAIELWQQTINAAEKAKLSKELRLQKYSVAWLAFSHYHIALLKTDPRATIDGAKQALKLMDEASAMDENYRWPVNFKTFVLRDLIKRTNDDEERINWESQLTLAKDRLKVLDAKS
jgi:tetratricopeptide (TPR) repeat protein